MFYNMDKNQWDKIYKKEGDKYKYYDIYDPHPDIDKVVKIFKKNKVQKVLDLGSGAGRNLWYLVSKGFDLYGIDLAAEGIELTKKYLKKKKLSAELKVGDVFKKLAYLDNFFDAIVSVQVLQHADEPTIKKTIKEMERILKPGGLLFATLCGRCSKGKVRHCLVKTAKKIAPFTYLPTQGSEQGLTHYIYNKDRIEKHYKNFKISEFWLDDKDYYCFVGQKKGR